MNKLRISIRSLLIFTTLVAIVVFLQVRLNNRVDDFEKSFENVSNPIHQIEGAGRLWSIKDVAVSDISTVTDRLMFRRRLKITYKASLIDGINTETTYECSSEFVISNSTATRSGHSEQWYMTLT